SQIVLQLWAPGRVQAGVPLADGSRLTYRLNGWVSFWVSLAAALVAGAAGVIPAGVAFDEFGPLLTTANLIAGALALGLYAQGRRAGSTTRDPIHDYFMGTTLNPRLRGFDLKYFCESRPGLILWVLFDLSLAAAQYERHGTVRTAAGVHPHRRRLVAADLRLVGHRAPPELPRRPRHGPRLVSAHGVGAPLAVLLLRLHDRPARPPRAPRQRRLPGEIRRGLGRV